MILSNVEKDFRILSTYSINHQPHQKLNYYVPIPFRLNQFVKEYFAKKFSSN